jgi:hypothetical protein
MEYDYSDDAYGQLAKDAEVDDRIGDHLFLVTEVIKDRWPDGGPRLKVKGNLVTANNAKTDWTFSPPPPPDVVAAEKANWDQGKKRAISNSITMVKQLGEHYGMSPGKIKQGDEFKVKTGKRTDRNDKTKYFVSVVAFLPKDHAVNGAGGDTTATPAVGF